MKQVLGAMLVMVMLSAACGDDGDETSSGEAATAVDSSSADNDMADDNDGDDASSGAVANQAPAGQASVTVGGQDIAFDEVLAGGCTISDDAITYGFAAADGVTTLAAGLNRMDGEWLGSIAVDVPNPDGEGVIGYYPAPAEGATLEEGSVAVDGSSMSYSGPMLMQPPNDGTNPPPVEVGDGTISVTC
jgi:hypothetical protein